MKIHNPTSTDIAEVPVLNGAPLKSGASIEVSEEQGNVMLKIWEFLTLEQGQVEEKKMTELNPDEPEQTEEAVSEPAQEEKPKRVKKEKK